MKNVYQTSAYSQPQPRFNRLKCAVIEVNTQPQLCNFRTGALGRIRSSKSLQNLEAITSSVTSNLKVDFQSFR